jgi:hypothetical protein
MQKGFARPLLLILLFLVIALPLTYKVVSNRINSTKSENVKGSSSVNEKPGFSVRIVSADGTWELIQYVCVTQEECTSGLTSGKRVGSVGGGATELQEIFVPTAPEWKDYKYIKYFVKPGWSSTQRVFKISDLGTFANSIKKSFTEADAVIAPIESILTTFQKSATFSDK